VNDYQNRIHGKSYPCVSEAEFLRKNGDPPWNLVNDILRQFDTMKYQVNSPEGIDIFANFQLKLQHTERADLEIEFDSLSSGEKILMALVASVYKSQGDSNFPEILLLDEIDASLHPSMIKNMLSVIGNVFLRHGVQVILVTHSPTTIALAPEDSIYLMNPSGAIRIVQSDRQEALGILTQGFATIEEGLKLFDEVARQRLTVITEGNNVAYIQRVLEINGIDGVEVMEGLEGITGKNQLRTLFDFFCRAPHENAVLFVWDPDVTMQLSEQNNTIPFIFDFNTDNELAKRGIENLFPEECFDGFIKVVNFSTGHCVSEFDTARKSDFVQHIIERNRADDFTKFHPVVEKIRALCEQTGVR